ncbi:Alpha/Beta hydrolase protein [Mycena sanguinolenta]|nr:Alpha/Beta hydrolase protein [Mycena sanguinolenta]
MLLPLDIRCAHCTPAAWLTSTNNFLARTQEKAWSITGIAAAPALKFSVPHPSWTLLPRSHKSTCRSQEKTAVISRQRRCVDGEERNMGRSGSEHSTKFLNFYISVDWSTIKAERLSHNSAISSFESMQALTLACFLVVLFFSASFASPVLTSRFISSTLYNDFIRYTKYSSAVYQPYCPRPLGNTLVEFFSEGGTQAFIARDDSREEIVVSFRGSFTSADAATDLDIFLVPFVSLGISKTFNVHSGFLVAYNRVAAAVLTGVKTQVAKFPKYSVIVTGHSLGGSLAAIGATSLKVSLPKTTIKLYTFGQPRTGDQEFATFVESTVGVDNIFRAVHTFDGVPTIIPRFLGYEHHGTEYWQFQDPGLSGSPSATVRKCIGQEDPTCSDSILSTGINPAHLFYFGQMMAINPSLCY